MGTMSRRGLITWEINDKKADNRNQRDSRSFFMHLWTLFPGFNLFFLTVEWVREWNSLGLWTVGLSSHSFSFLFTQFMVRKTVTRMLEQTGEVKNGRGEGGRKTRFIEGSFVCWQIGSISSVPDWLALWDIMRHEADDHLILELWCSVFGHLRARSGRAG